LIRIPDVQFSHGFMSIIRVVSYNIHKGRSALMSRESLKALRLGLHGLRPDLLFLQEVQGRNEHESRFDAQHESLGAALRMDVAYGRNAIRDQTDHGNALLSRYPILDYENQDISDHRMERRGLLHARVRLADCDVHCFVVHLGLFAASRSRQVVALTERIERLVPAGCPILIAGDFNDWADRLSPLFVEKLGLYEVFSNSPRTYGGEHPKLREQMRRLSNVLRGVPNALAGIDHTRQLSATGTFRAIPPPRTFPAVFPWLRLDRIYQRGFAVRTARVLSGREWAKLSDHSPILTELELP
jgi:endonuclease/exonuclease/phosphatase family metal-dependent hydrolase